MRRARTNAFTLIELILVMGLLAMVLGFAAPALSAFVKGRSLKEESRRFLALTRYARSEAASRSVTMQLWIEPDTGTYGVQPAQGFETIGGQPIEYRLADGLHFEIENDANKKETRVEIQFSPDGSIESESVESLKIVEDESHSVRIARVQSLVGYEVADAND